MKARIIKEHETKTERDIYYIEKKRTFLWWSWWCRETISHPLIPEVSVCVTYDTHEKALERYNQLTQTTTRTIVS